MTGERCRQHGIVVSGGSEVRREHLRHWKRGRSSMGHKDDGKRRQRGETSGLSKCSLSIGGAQLSCVFENLPQKEREDLKNGQHPGLRWGVYRAPSEDHRVQFCIVQRGGEKC